MVYRYVNILKNNDKLPIKLEIKESFLGFYIVIDQSASGITTNICNLLDRNYLDISKCRGQGYDGTNTMSGI